MRRDTKYEDDHKKGLQIKTNLAQVLTIIVMFLAMFVLPIQLYSLFEHNQEAKQIAPYTQGSVQGVSTTVGQTKGIADTVSQTFKNTDPNLLIYIGVGGALLAAVIVYLIIRSSKE